MKQIHYDRNEKLWYFEVPKDYILFTNPERYFFHEEENEWCQIDFVRANLPIVWSAGQPVSAFDSGRFLTEFFWDLRKDEEAIQFKVLEKKGFRRMISIAEFISDKTELGKILENVILKGSICCALYKKDGDDLKRAIVLWTGECMNIYLKAEEIAAMKEYLSQFAEETEYRAYHLGELD